MAKRSSISKKKTFDKGSENVAAAFDALDSMNAALAKSVQVIRHRIEELDETVEDLESRTRDLEDGHAVEVANMKDRYTRDTTTLSTKLQAAEEKLKKVQATLA